MKVSTHGANWGTGLAKGIDKAVAELSSDHDVVSVSVTPIYNEHYSTQAGYASAIKLVTTSTTSVIVTVVWRE